MARFRGTVQGHRGQASRLGHGGLVTDAATWTVALRVEWTEDPDGDRARVVARDVKTGASVVLWAGTEAQLARRIARAGRAKKGA